MVAFMEEVTLEKDWDTNVFLDSIIKEWKAHAMTRNWQQYAGIRHGDFTETMFECCIDELQEKAEIYRQTGIVAVLDIAVRLARSDRVIPPELQQSLKIAAIDIERTTSFKTYKNIRTKNTQIETTDSTSANTAIQLIDPTLYPLIYGRSRVLPDKEIGLDDCLRHMSKGNTVPMPDDTSRTEDCDDAPYRVWSGKSQWLPCNVEFPDGKNAKINSYINNLHLRHHADVYKHLEKFITNIMPLWNLVYCTVYEDTIPCDMRIFWQEAYRSFPGEAPYDPLNIKDDLMNGLIDDDEWQRRTEEWLHDHSVTDRPEPRRKNDRSYVQDSPVTCESLADNTVMLGNSGAIQVIVKMETIHLTPGSPVHDLRDGFILDGVLNDHIVATALHFFDDENVTDSRIRFKSRFQGLNFEEDCGYNDGDFACVDEIFGFRRSKFPSLQDVGFVTMREGLTLVYPNILQHKHSSFQLKDATRPGHRKILTLHLVDPRVKVLSTANVPPQQADWWAGEFSTSQGQMNVLPKELVDIIVDNVSDFPIPKEEALRLRDEMLAERAELSDKVRSILSSYKVKLGWFTDSEDDSGGSEDEF
nr:uncharacterized protein CTRU02_15579 [Colletotrichum truncatum]KAF6780922.1 hypothetical protein CTRU02_15579 [Colletotrichum truncatum]